MMSNRQLRAELGSKLSSELRILSTKSSNLTDVEEEDTRVRETLGYEKHNHFLLLEQLRAKSSLTIYKSLRVNSRLPHKSLIPILFLDDLYIKYLNHQKPN